MCGCWVVIKLVLLVGDIVVGVGNIYCLESLFCVGIWLIMVVGCISWLCYVVLVEVICVMLVDVIVWGGSMLCDFVGLDGQSGYFQFEVFVYDCVGLLCCVCGMLICQIVQGQCFMFYCLICQC